MLLWLSVEPPPPPASITTPTNNRKTMNGTHSNQKPQEIVSSTNKWRDLTQLINSMELPNLIERETQKIIMSLGSDLSVLPRAPDYSDMRQPLLETQKFNQTKSTLHWSLLTFFLRHSFIVEETSFVIVHHEIKMLYHLIDPRPCTTPPPTKIRGWPELFYAFICTWLLSWVTDCVVGKDTFSLDDHQQETRKPLQIKRYHGVYCL